MMKPVTLKDNIKAEAVRLGFILCGVTDLTPPPHVDVFNNWLSAGRQAGMAYLATERSRQRRADPKLILPQAQSMLSLGIPYEPNKWNTKIKSGQLVGKVASYAWGKDYHEVLAPRLRRLVEYIEKETGQSILHREYTDTGPLLERDLAQRAGLGWIGKNTCLIHPRYGSNFLLSEILLEAEIEPDPPFSTDHCGSCTRCIDSCPTQAILPDRTIDSGRCISYLTIENKGEIDPELRPKMDNWVFGCDICQMVCPWNERFATLPGDPDLEPTKGNTQPILTEELLLSPQQFNRRFKGSPVLRAKRRGYLRNVAIALGNSGDPAAIPHLKKAIHNEPEPLVRQHIAWALGEIGTQTAKRVLAMAVAKEENAVVHAEIQKALRDRGSIVGKP